MTPEELVRNEVIYCVSYLISYLAKVADQLDDYDEYMNLIGGKPDYEEAAWHFILNDADLSDLEEIVEQYAWWSEVVEAVVDPVNVMLRPYVVTYVDDEDVGEEEFSCWAENPMHANEQCRDAYPNAQIESSRIDTDIDLEEWCDNNPSLLDDLRKKTWGVVDIEGGAYEWVCENFDLDPEYGEIYEHWIVSDWLGRKLSERGHIVENYLGMTIWGRGCTGQAISMDGVMEQICNDL